MALSNYSHAFFVLKEDRIISSFYYRKGNIWIIPYKTDIYIGKVRLIDRIKAKFKPLHEAIMNFKWNNGIILQAREDEGRITVTLFGKYIEIYYKSKYNNTLYFVIEIEDDIVFGILAYCPEAHLSEEFFKEFEDWIKSFRKRYVDEDEFSLEAFGVYKLYKLIEKRGGIPRISYNFGNLYFEGYMRAVGEDKVLLDEILENYPEIAEKIAEEIGLKEILEK